MLFIDRQGGAEFAMADALAGENYLDRLEARLEYDYGRSAVAVCSADAALHTALGLCGVRAGDYVFVPGFTFYSNIATVTHAGALPVFIDSEPKTRCMSDAALETALVWAELQNKPPKAVIADDAFGSVADYDRLLPLCKAHGVPLIELACDAYGGSYNGKPCGALGDYGVVSFCKRVGGGGGALMLGAEEKPAALKFCRSRYTTGENHDYKMHNVIAALDWALLDAAKKITARARNNLAALCGATDAVAPPVAGDAATYALCRAEGAGGLLRAQGLNVKEPPPVHTLPQYVTCPFFEHEPGFCVCREFAGYRLVDMDISALRRRKLARILRAANDE